MDIVNGSNGNDQPSSSTPTPMDIQLPSAPPKYKQLIQGSLDNLSKRVRTGITVAEAATEAQKPATLSDIRHLLSEVRQDIEAKHEERSSKLEKFLQQQNTKIISMQSTVEQVADNQKNQKWIRSKSANIKITPTASPTVAAFDFQGAITPEQQHQKNLDACNWIVGQFSYTPIKQQCRIITPRSPGATKFMVIKFASEPVADYIKSQWPKFRAIGVYVGEDLTPSEYATRNAILAIMKPYWGRTQIPISRFLRDQLKCEVDGKPRILSLHEVQAYTHEKRIGPFKESKNVIAGQHMNLDSYDSLVQHLSAPQRFEYLAQCVINTRTFIKQHQQQQAVQHYVSNNNNELLSTEHLVHGKFRVFCQNVNGILVNRDLLFALLSSKHYHIIALTETHTTALPAAWNKIIQQSGYKKLSLSARKFHNAGRMCGGICVFVKQNIPISTVVKEYTDFGEHLSFYVDNNTVFHVVYRNPSTPLQLISAAFTDILNTTQQHFFMGDFNFEMLRAPSQQRILSDPVSVSKLSVPLPNVSKSTYRQARTATKILARFPLFVLSKAIATHSQGRCIDWIFCNTVAVNTSCANNSCNSNIGSTLDLSSDHKSVSFGCNLQIGWLQQTTGVSLKLGYRATVNEIIQLNAYSHFTKLLTMQTDVFDKIPASVGLAAFSTILFCCFSMADYQYSNTFPASPPSYALVYRNFRNIIQKVPSLSAQRRILRSQKFKYNIIHGSALKKNLLKTSFNHLSFLKVLARQQKDSVVVQAQPQEISTHFQQFFNKPVECSQLPQHLLQYYEQIPSAKLHTLSTPITATEIRTAISEMNSSAAPGIWGLQVPLVQQLFSNECFANTLTALINAWILDDNSTAELFLVLLSAIPKPQKSTDIPANLRPISVTSVWYKIVAKIFTLRMAPLLQQLYSANQHGFCPQRSVSTALLNIVATLDWATTHNDSMYMLQLDVNKAYDSVDRNVFHQIMNHMGLSSVPLFQFIERGMSIGQVSVSAATGRLPGFLTTRGIRQGCPASPLLFALYLSGLERYLCTIHPSAGWQIAQQQQLITTYADDIKLISKDPLELQKVFDSLQSFLNVLGLSVDPGKCKVLCINTSQKSIKLREIVLKSEQCLRFLGIKIRSDGSLTPWYPSSHYTNRLWGLWARLKHVGLHHYPRALVKAYNIFVQPALCFGCEIWAIHDIFKCIRQQKSPYLMAPLDDIMAVFKSAYGLAPNTFNAPIFQLFGIKPLFQKACTQMVNLWQSLDASLQSILIAVQSASPMSRCGKLCTIVDEWAASGLPLQPYLRSVLDTYWRSHRSTGRHSQFFAVFGSAPIMWTCFTQKVSFRTTTSLLRFLTLSHPYFYSGRQFCPLCRTKSFPSLHHILYSCLASTKVCEQHNVPSNPLFGRIFLAARSGCELDALVKDLVRLFDQETHINFSRPPLPLHPRSSSDIPYVCTFDGSFQSHGTQSVAGVGVTIHKQDVCLLSAAIPVKSKDAQRTEALGPPLAALFLSLLPAAPVIFHGDSAYVIGLLNQEYYSQDIFLYNCVALVQDILGINYPYMASWISRDINLVCDALARRAANESTYSLVVDSSLPASIQSDFQDLAANCVHYFTQRY